MGHSIFPLFRSKPYQNNKNFENLCIFSPCLSLSKFYYITHLCEIERTRKFDFFNFFKVNLYAIFLDSNFTWKICSFEVHYVNVALQISEWEGCNNCKNGQIGPPTNLLIFVVHQHNVPQKNIFFMWNQFLKRIHKFLL